MGWDISYHPVDVEFVHRRVIPFVRGETDLDDLWPDALRIAKVRFHANAWGLGLLQLASELNAVQQQASKNKQQRGFIKRLFAKDKRSDETQVPRTRINGFDCDVQVWGRPFFICAASPEEVSRTIDRYLVAEVDDVRIIARDMLEYLDSLEGNDSIADVLGGPLVDRVQPLAEGKLPGDEEIVRAVRWKLDLFRDAFQARKAGRKVKGPDGNQLDPREILATDFALAVLEFAAHFRPGWMARGYGWPTELLSKVDARGEGHFERPVELFAPILEEVPEVATHLQNTIVENYMIGGYVSAAKVSSALKEFRERSASINDWARSEDWGDEGAEVYLAGIREALFDAQRRGLAFVEATEVYSGAMGAMN